jgi:hypothetical protein
MGNIDNLRVVLGSLRYKSAPNTNLFFQVPLLQTHKEMDEFDRSVDVSLEQVFDDERQISDLFRPTCKFSLIFKNKFSGTTNYPPFENNLYYVNAEVAAAAQCQFGSSTVWSGYPQFNEFDFVRNDYNISGYTIPSGNTSPPIVHVNFVSKSASSYNWNFYLTYAYDNVDRQLEVLNKNNVLISWSASTGIPFTIQKRIANGKPLITFNSPMKHGLSVGEYVILSLSYNNNSIFQVYTLGNEFFNTDEYSFNIIDVGYTGTTFNNGVNGTLKRVINNNNTSDTISKYYIRRHQILTNPEDAVMVKAGFEQNIFGSKKKYESSGFTPNGVARVSVLEGSQAYTLSFNNDIRINPLLDNQKRPLTELFFTILWKGYFGWTLGKDVNNDFRKLKQGYQFNLPNGGTPTNWWAYSNSKSNTNFNYSEYTRDSYTFTYVDSLRSGDILDGAFCEWNDYEQKERVISHLYHKLTYNSNVFNLNETSVTTNPKGYYYEPHYPLTIRVFSDYIEDAPPQNNYDIPNYAYFSVNDNAFKWRDIYSYGYVDTTGLGVNYPFLNGSHYPYGNFMFRIIPEGTDFVEQTIIEDPITDPCE